MIDKKLAKKRWEIFDKISSFLLERDIKIISFFLNRYGEIEFCLEKFEILLEDKDNKANYKYSIKDKTEDFVLIAKNLEAVIQYVEDNK